MKPGDKITLTIQSLAKGGEGAGRCGNFVVFVPFAAPGDTLEIEITEAAKRHARGVIRSIIKASADRVTPPCPFFGSCGGCQLQHINYEPQLRYKEEFFSNFLKHHGKFIPKTISPAIKARSPFNYRNKMQFVVGKGKISLDHPSDGAYEILDKRNGVFLTPDTYGQGKCLRHKSVGLYMTGSHSVVDIDECLIQSDISNQILSVFKEVLKNSPVIPYDELTGEGDLRNILIRAGEGGKSALVVLVAARSPFTDEEKIVNSLAALSPLVKGVFVNINNRRGNFVFGEKTILRWGDDSIEEEIDGLRFKIGPTSFFQVHTGQIGKFYDVLDRWLPGNIETSFDAYAGVGTFSLWLAKRAKHVIHVEVNKDAAKMAEINAILNNISNIEICPLPVEEEIVKLKEKSWDAGLLDPPRSGLSNVVIEHLKGMNVNRLVYISCNPSTFIRDLNQLAAPLSNVPSAAGHSTHYTVEEIQPIDLFPHTGHLELMAIMERP